MRGYLAFQNDEELEMLLPEIRSKLMEAAEKHFWLSQDALEKVISWATIPGQRQWADGVLPLRTGQNSRSSDESEQRPPHMAADDTDFHADTAS